MNHPFFGQALHVILDRMQHCLNYDIAVRPEHFERDFDIHFRQFARQMPNGVKAFFHPDEQAVICGYWRDIYAVATAGERYLPYPKLGGFEFDLMVERDGVYEMIEVVSHSHELRDGYSPKSLRQSRKNLIHGRAALKAVHGDMVKAAVYAFRNDVARRHEPTWIPVTAAPTTPA